MDSTQELEQQVRRLQAELAEMRARMAGLERQAREAAPPARSDRRGFLKMGAGAVLGAAGMAAARVLPASAATGGNFILGQANVAENPTSLAADTNNSVPVLSAASLNHGTPTLTNFHGPLQGLGDTVSSGDVDGVDGWADSPTAFAVYGLTSQGVGVAGESSTGVSLLARGTGRIQQVGYNTPGTGQAPNFPGDTYEMLRDQDGVMWISNPAGAWRRVNTPRSDTAAGDGNGFKPFRLIDTRSGLTNGVTVGGNKGPFGTSSHNFTVAGTGSGAQTIPSDAVAVFGNITITSFTGSGWAIIAPRGAGTNPGSDPSSVNWGPGMAPAIANSFFCGLGTGTTNGGQVTVYLVVSTGSAVNFIVDITGYVQ